MAEAEAALRRRPFRADDPSLEVVDQPQKIKPAGFRVSVRLVDKPAGPAALVQGERGVACWNVLADRFRRALTNRPALSTPIDSELEIITSVRSLAVYVAFAAGCEGVPTGHLLVCQSSYASCVVGGQWVSSTTHQPTNQDESRSRPWLHSAGTGPVFSRSYRTSSTRSRGDGGWRART